MAGDSELGDQLVKTLGINWFVRIHAKRHRITAIRAIRIGMISRPSRSEFRLAIPSENRIFGFRRLLKKMEEDLHGLFSGELGFTNNFGMDASTQHVRGDLVRR